MTINEIQDNIIEEFSQFDDWMDKYALLIDLGNSLEALDEKHKTPQNIITGWFTFSGSTSFYIICRYFKKRAIL